MMSEALAKITASVDLRDIHCYSGIVLVGAGAGVYSLGAGLIVVGLALFYLALRRV